MTTYKEETKKYKIEVLLEKVRGNKSEFSRMMWISNWALRKWLRRWLRTIRVQKKYTDAYNMLFLTNYTYKELFSLEE